MNENEKVRIGENVLIGEGVRLGTQPMILRRNDEGDYKPKQPMYGVVIGDGCTIGPNTVIHAGYKDDTELNPHVHVGALVNIGHDCRINSNTMIMPCTVLNGHVQVGENTRIYGGSIVRNRAKIGSNCIIGMGSVVTKDIPDDTFGYGNPFKPRKRGLSWNRLKMKARMLGVPI